MIITVACPESLIDAANHLAMCLAFSERDGETYKAPTWQDVDGNLYACTSFPARDEWIAGASSQLVRPTWDVDEVIDLTAAATAQAALALWIYSSEEDAPDASSDAVTAIMGMTGLAAITAMGLERVESEEEE